MAGRNFSEQVDATRLEQLDGPKLTVKNGNKRKLDAKSGSKQQREEGNDD
jgi:hypothetical protein